MKTHLLKHFETAAGHHVELGKVHRRLQEAHRAIAGHLGDGEHADGHRDIAKAHREAAELHADHAAHLLKMHKSLEEGRGEDADLIHPGRITGRGSGEDLDGPRKAALPWTHWDRGGLLDKLVPTDVRAVGTLGPDSGSKLIPRPGQPAIAGNEADPALRKLVTGE